MFGFILSLFRPSGSSLKGISTTNDDYEFIGTSSADRYTVTGDVYAGRDGTNLFDMGRGNDTLTIRGRLESKGANEIDMGDGNNSLCIRGVLADGYGTNTIKTGDGNDSITITGSLETLVSTAVNRIEMGDGRDCLTITGRMLSEEGENMVNLGDGRNTMTLGGVRTDGGYNEIRAGQDNDVVTIAGKVMADKGANFIDLGDGNNKLSILGGLDAQDNSTNNILLGDGDDVINLGKLFSADGNYVDAGHGDNIVNINAGMNADGGENRITTGDGDDIVTVHGTVTADLGMNIIYTGDGDDVISLHGRIDVDALNVSGSEGYDVLVLNAANADRFTDYYQDWLETADVQYSGIEAVRVNIGARATDTADIDWLASTLGPDVSIELCAGSAGRNLSLDDFFGKDSANVFDVIDLSGGYINTLTIDGTLADNNVDDISLRINGDSRDKVKISDDWALSESKVLDDSGVSYDVYTNDNGDSLMLQMELSVTFIA